MRVNRSIFLGLLALVAAVGMLGANGYYWWVAQSKEATSPSNSSNHAVANWPAAVAKETSTEAEPPTRWWSPYRNPADDPETRPRTNEEGWRHFFPHQSQHVEMAQADGFAEPPTDVATAPTEPPAPLLFPDPVAPLEPTQSETWLDRLIVQELPNASEEERRIWSQEMKGFEPEVVLDILRMKKGMSGLVTPDRNPGYAQPLPPESPAREKLVPPPVEVWDASSEPLASRLGPTLVALEQARNVSLNNLANLHTVGFKRSRVAFSPLSYYGVEAPATSLEEHKSTIAVGSGVELAATLLDTTQGPIKSTKQPLDVAIEGAGFFQVRDGNEIYFTRCGLWTTDAKGRLCIASGTALKPLEPEILLPAEFVSVDIAEDGVATVMTTAETSVRLGEIKLARFRNPSGLKPVEGNMLAATATSGPPQIGIAKSPGFGILRQGVLELANVSREEELEQFELVQTHLQLLKQLGSARTETVAPGPVARQPSSRTVRASAQTSKMPPQASLEPLRKLGAEGRNLIEDYLHSERLKSFKRTLGLK